jgi:hypothetical protein
MTRRQRVKGRRLLWRDQVFFRDDFVQANGTGRVRRLLSEVFAQRLGAEEDPGVTVSVVVRLFKLRDGRQDGGQIMLVRKGDEGCSGSLISSRRDGEAMHER